MEKASSHDLTQFEDLTQTANDAPHDPAAARRLWAIAFPFAHQYAKRIVGGPFRPGESPTEVAVGAIEKVMIASKPVRYADRGHLSRWLRRQVRNTWVDITRGLRAKKRAPREGLVSLESPGSIAVSSPDPGPAEIAAGREELDRLAEAMARLKTGDADAHSVAIRRMNEQSVNAIARDLGWTPAQVLQSWQSARAFLQSALRGSGEMHRPG